MKIVVAFVVLMSIGAASAQVSEPVRENVKVYNPSTKMLSGIKPIRPIK